MSQAPAFIVIYPNGDLVLEVTDFNYRARGGNGNHPVQRVARFTVSRSVLENSSRHLKGLQEWNSTKQVVALEDETIASTELWLRVLHDAMTEDMYKLSIEEVWNAIVMGRKRFLENERLNDWFEEWLLRKGDAGLKKFKLDELQQLLFPCEEFDHVRGFAAASRRLTYEFAGHITEINPLSYRGIKHLRLDQRVIAAINDARVGLKSKIHNPIWAATEPFLLDSRNCTCKVKTHFEFSKCLFKTGVWPLEKHFYGPKRKSVEEILDALDEFKFTPPPGSCTKCCRPDLEDMVGDTIVSVQGNFGGLCLDCMAKPKLGSRDEDYKKNKALGWDHGCRFKHDQPTFWYSSLAASKEPDAHRREQAERRLKRSRDRVAEERA